MSFLIGKWVVAKEQRGQIPAPLAFCVIGTVAGSGDLLLGGCHVA